MNRILDKIKKCMALSQSSEPHEAAAALRQAQKLMEMHGISQSDLKIADITEVEVKSTASVSRIKNWELKLMNLVSKAFGCSLLWRSSSSYNQDVYGAYTIIGLKSQVPLAEYTAQVLLRKLRKARAEFVNGLPALDRQAKIREADGFCLGWVEKISATVHSFAASEELTGAIEAYTEANHGKMKSKKAQRREAGSYGYRAGLTAAEGESLNRPMNEVKRARLT